MRGITSCRSRWVVATMTAMCGAYALNVIWSAPESSPGIERVQPKERTGGLCEVALRAIDNLPSRRRKRVETPHANVRHNTLSTSKYLGGRSDGCIGRKGHR